MPTFDFTCRDCTTTFEFNRRFGSTEHPKCSKCGSHKTEKQLHAPNIAFKGSGFYVTDTSKATNAATKPAEVAPEPTTPKKTEKDTQKTAESKPVTP